MDEISAFLNTNFIYSQQLLETIISKLNVTQPQIEEATNNSNNASTYYTALITPPVIPPIVNPYSYINFINICMKMIYNEMITIMYIRHWTK